MPIKEPPVIDHDPKEPKRTTTGEAVFVTVVTGVVLTALGYALRAAFDTYGLAFGFGAVILLGIICFGIAFALERRK